MRTIKIVVALGVLCLPLATLSAPTMAATAHNSQRGGLGNSSNNSGPSGMMMRKHQMSGKKRKAM